MEENRNEFGTESTSSSENPGGRRTRSRGGARRGGYPVLYAIRTRKAVEAAAVRICNLLLSKQLTAPETHAVLAGVRLVYDSMALTERVESEYRLKEIAEEMRQMREVNQQLYSKLVELGVAPPVDTSLS
jgi:hypothetical protein